ncbi:hypothetical protein AgCh_032096 [Apium graveolens]
MFTAGLVESLRMDVEMQNPPNLVTPMNLARAFERKMQLNRASTNTWRPQTTWAAPRAFETSLPSATSREHRSSTSINLKLQTSNNSKSVSSTGSSVIAPPIRRLSKAGMFERRAKGQCFNCDELYSAGHKCKRLFCLLVVDENEDYEEESHLLEPEISLNAITGIKNFQTIQLQARIDGKPILILVNSGSMHNFINEKAALQLNLQMEIKPRLQVAVANGEKVHFPGICKEVQIQVDSESFTADLFVLNLDGFDVVLGVKWLSTLGPILLDFNSLNMTFCLNDKRVTWQGKLVEANHLQVHMLKEETKHALEMGRLLADFSNIFQEPKGIPPPRSCDHKLTLLNGSEPVVVRPYRYPHLQKDEIKRKCAEMLKQGIIRPSRSPFSSPILLVAKHVGTWRFCVYYRELNNKIIKDKFPIPVVDELLDELHGARYFTKLDLRSEYFQVRMDPADIEKTAFRTHHGHFEFLVMSFGLTNAPSTFQSLMNELQNALSITPVLQLPNFDIEFVVECDASGMGIGAVLQQQGHPIAFFSRKLVDRHLKLPAYERELIGLARAVQHWRPYLWGRSFVIKTDHYSLKYLLEQRLVTPPQQHWVSKLLGFDF